MKQKLDIIISVLYGMANQFYFTKLLELHSYFSQCHKCALIIFLMHYSL